MPTEMTPGGNWDWAVKVALETLVRHADEERRGRIARFLKRELTVEQAKELYDLLR